MIDKNKKNCLYQFIKYIRGLDLFNQYMSSCYKIQINDKEVLISFYKTRNS